MSAYAVPLAAVMLAAFGACGQQSDTSQPGSNETVTADGNAAAGMPATPLGNQAAAPGADRVGEALRAAGYTRWDDIEREDGVWEVEDARQSDGSEWDLTLDPATLQVTTRRQTGPSTSQRGRIETALRAAGYVGWDDIERDDDRPLWEIEDARRADGSKWDLKLNVDTLAIVEVERDDD